MSDNPTSSKAPVAVLEYEPSAFEDMLLKHKSKLILVAVLAVAGTGGYWGYRLYKEASHKSAAVAFVRANTVEELRNVASKYEGQTAAGNALILAAENMSSDRPKEAVDMLRDFLARNPQHPLRDLAAYRIAEYLMLSGDTAGAANEYETVAKSGTAYSAFALLRLGDLSWGAGDTTKAQEYYNKILTDGAMSASPVRAVAQNRVEKGLKTKPPVLVEYKEEPPPPTPGAPNINVPGLGDINVDPGTAPGGDSLLPPPDLGASPTAPAPASTPVPSSPAEAVPAIPGEAPPPASEAPAEEKSAEKQDGKEEKQEP